MNVLDMISSKYLVADTEASILNVHLRATLVNNQIVLCENGKCQFEAGNKIFDK